MKTIEVLTEARALVARGWCQLSMKRGSKRCLWGAVLDASQSYTEAELARSVLVDVIGDELIAWNDVPGRTQTEVLTALDDAVARSAS